VPRRDVSVIRRIYRRRRFIAEKVMRVMWIAAALMTAVSVAGTVQAQEGTTEAEMRGAREQLEAAAREVARLAAVARSWA
jgi:hypothetical protein